MHASVYREGLGLALATFWVSEKLDGVRAFWDGERLQTRSGHAIAAPDWFTSGLPRVALDGELWGGRGTFEGTSGVVRKRRPLDADWRSIKFMVFDMPLLAGVFNERLRVLNDVAARAAVEWLTAIPQFRVDDTNALTKQLRRIESLGGEGLMLHRGEATYTPGRTDDLLKLKSFEDAEAKVIGYEPGKGKYEGWIGALLVERDDGVQFKVGSGLSDAQRRAPPPIGSTVTYAHNGLTQSGMPRFPRLVRVRSDEEG